MSDKIRVQVSYSRESESSWGVLVDLVFGEDGHYKASSRLEWFSKNLCELEKVEVENHVPAFFLTAPKWLLDKKNVKHHKK